MKRLLDAGYTLDEVARTVGKKPATVERDLELLKLAPEVRHMLTASPEQRLGKRLAYELVKLSHQSQRAVLRKIGGKTFSKQKAIIQALYLQENQIDLFGQAAMETNGNRLKAVHSKWEMFKLNCKGLNKLAESDLRALVTMMEGNVAHNLAAIEGTLRTLTRLRDHVHVFAGMKKGRAA